MFDLLMRGDYPERQGGCVKHTLRLGLARRDTPSILIESDERPAEVIF
jgi:hypothetical protein